MGIRREISGNDYLLFIDKAGGTNWDLIVCLTENSIDRTTNEIDAASKCGPNLLPGTQVIKVSFAFHDVLDTANGEISEWDLHTLWAAKTIISFKFGKVTPAAGDITYTGTGFIASLNLKATQNSPVDASGSIGVQGTLTATRTGS
jgi:hypothetical protein